MKKLYTLFITLFITAASFGQTTELFFSMYGEGSSNNKFLEIFNGTGATIDLGVGGYSIELYPNGATTPNNTLTFTSGTTIASGDVYVIYNSSAVASITTPGDMASTVTFFNGDDAIALLKSGTVIDVIGSIGVDPGSSWAVGSTSDGTVNHTLVRKSSVCSPNAVALASFGTDDATSEWTVYASDTEWSQIGSFTSTCATASVEKNQIAGFSMYPNPVVHGKILISSNNSAAKQVAIYNLVGQQVYNKSVIANEAINVTSLTKGMYILKVEEEGKIATRKLLIN